MSDELVPYENLSKDQTMFILRGLALGEDPLEVQRRYNLYYSPEKISGMTLDKIKSIYNDGIVTLRTKIYTNEVSSLPIANTYNRMSIAQIRAEWLIKNEVVQRTVRLTGDDGKDYWAEVKGIDDKALLGWVEFAQREEFLNKRLQLEMILKKIEDEGISNSGCKPTTIINTRISAADFDD
jgi:hypothetical protein